MSIKDQITARAPAALALAILVVGCAAPQAKPGRPSRATAASAAPIIQGSIPQGEATPSAAMPGVLQNARIPAPSPQ